MSEGQFLKVLASELRAIRSACAVCIFCWLFYWGWGTLSSNIIEIITPLWSNSSKNPLLWKKFFFSVIYETKKNTFMCRVQGRT